MEAEMIRQSEKITALYCRLAHYDNELMDHAIAQNQMNELSRYAETNGLPNPQFFCDWGFSGTSHKRPEYQRMLRLMKQGQVSNLVVWDMSRLARGFTACGKLLETVLSRYGVTFHSVKDGLVYAPQEMRELAATNKALYAFFRQEQRRGGRR